MAWQTQYVQWGNDGTALATSASVTADGVVGSAVDLGRGRYDMQVTVTSMTTGDGFDSAVIIFQANKASATTTWTEIGNVVLGDATGRGAALTNLTNAIVPVKNEDDYQVRAYCYINGSTTALSGVTIKAYPLARKDI